ncbi:MAG: VanW family protein [Lachnospiraceae bacterium]|nr:VanW family protein [Lachnospiraceae bacterium]
MKKLLWLTAGMFAMLFVAMPVKAATADTIPDGVYAGEISLSGMTEDEAKTAISEYVDSLRERQITFLAAGDHAVTVTAEELGIGWANAEIVKEAAGLGKEGNVIARYKAIKDLKHENRVYPIELSFDVQLINDVLVNSCAKYDIKAKNLSLVRENGEFTVVDGQIGYSMDTENSIDEVETFLTTKWDGNDCEIPLVIKEEDPKGSKEELANVQDLLGTFTTSYATSGYARSANVANGCALINGTTLYPGEEFSTYETVSPFSEANGYYMAGSYVNGKVVDSLGGGICQVSTTLYNAVLLSELEVTERHNHSMIVTYVSPSSDAAIAESSGKDFKFVNSSDYPIYIEGYVSNKHITFNVYGKETRPSSHEVKYESEVLERIEPQSDNIYADAGHPLGYVVSESAHIGYKARLWKVVYEDGKEVSREQVNSSTYKMSPRSATVGVATENPDAYNEIMAAIGTGSLDHVRNVLSIITTW